MAATASEILPQVDRILEDQVNQIWAYVREHRENLDSERGCKMIRVGCERAVEQVNQLLAEAIARLEVVSGRKAELKAECKEAHKLATELQSQLNAAEVKARDAQEALEASEKSKAELQARLDALGPKRKKSAAVTPPPAEAEAIPIPEPLTAKA